MHRAGWSGTRVHAYGDPGAVSDVRRRPRAAGLTGPPAPVAAARLADAQASAASVGQKEAQAAFKQPQAGVEEGRGEPRSGALGAWTAREDARLAVGTAIGFSGFHDAPVDGEVAVATDSPWVLGRVSAPTRIATYGDTPGAMDVLVEVLLGRGARARAAAGEGRRRGARPAARRQRSERLDEQGGALAGHPGQHEGRLVVAPEREPLAQLLGDDLDAALLDRQPADAALAQRGLSGFSR